MSTSAYEQRARDELRIPWPLFIGNIAAIDITPGTTIQTIKVENDAVIKRITASAQTLTAASQFVVELLRGALVIATVTSAVPYVAGVVASSGEITVPIYFDEVLTLRIRGSDADADVATYVRIEAGLQALADQDDAI